MLAYAIVGFIVFWVAWSLGEMAAYLPVCTIFLFLSFLGIIAHILLILYGMNEKKKVSGSFTIFCQRFVDHSFGAAIGYNYW